MAKLSLFDRRRRRVRTSLRARSAGKPRLSVHRSGRHIYAQVIDDTAGKTLAAASTLDAALHGNNIPTAVVETLISVTKAGVETKKAEVRMPAGPLKHIGEFPIVVQLHSDVLANITVTVVAEQ